MWDGLPACWSMLNSIAVIVLNLHYFEDYIMCNVCTVAVKDQKEKPDMQIYSDESLIIFYIKSNSNSNLYLNLNVMQPVINTFNIS